MNVKFWKLNLAILFGVVMVIGLFSYFAPTAVVEAKPEAQYVRPHVPYLVHYRADEATEDQWGIIIDLSDYTNYPHHNTNRIILKSLQVNGVLTDTEKWQLSLGVVVTSTATGTGVQWIHENTRYTATQFDYDWTLPEHGLNLMVSSDTLPFVFTTEVTATTTITSGTVITATSSVTATVGVGDLIGFVDEIEDGASLYVSVDVGYDTE